MRGEPGDEIVWTADLTYWVNGQLLEQWGGAPFVVGVADQVPPDGDIEFVRRISAMVKGKRP